MAKQRARGVCIESNVIMWMHRRKYTGILIKFDEGEYYGHFSRCAASVVSRERGY